MVVVGDCAGVGSGEAQRHKQELQAIKEPIESPNLCHVLVPELVKASTRLHELPFVVAQRTQMHHKLVTIVLAWLTGDDSRFESSISSPFSLIFCVPQCRKKILSSIGS